MIRPVAFRAAVSTAEIREGTYEGRTYVIAPVVMMVGDAVIRSMGSRGPEFVPLAELMRATEGWNGRPVVLNHPTSASGEPLLANSPEVLEATRFGYIFAAAVTNGKLTAEMWLDRDRATLVGAQAVRFIERVIAGEIADVSVGALVAIEEVTGRSASGQTYNYIWHDLVPDHLAALPEGTPGACSIELGCGTPRAAAASGGSKMNFINRFLSFFGARGAKITDKGDSNVDTYAMLERALRASEPAFEFIYEFFPDSETVVYAVSPNGELMWKRCKYSVGEDRNAMLSEQEEVVMKTTYEAVGAEGHAPVEASMAVEPEPAAVAAEPAPATEVKAVAEPVAACGCGGHLATETPAQKGAVKMEVTQTVKDLAGRLIACEGSPFQEGDRAVLETMSEARLSEFASTFEKPAPAPAPAAASAQTEEEWLKSAPASVRALVGRAQIEEKARNARLISVLKGAQSHYSEDQLKALSTERLDELASVLGIAGGLGPVDYSGAAMPAAAAGEYTPVDHTATALAALKARQGK